MCYVLCSGCWVQGAGCRVYMLITFAGQAGAILSIPVGDDWCLRVYFFGVQEFSDSGAWYKISARVQSAR